MSKLTEEILSRVDIVDVVSRYVNLKRAGSNFSGLSPFQKEKTPSFMVSPSKQIFKDFSSGLGGNVITFLMEVEKMDFWDAIQMLAKDARIDLSEYQKDPKKMAELGDEKEKIKRIHTLAQGFFLDELKKNPDAQNYLHDKRKLNDNILTQFGIGYAPENNYSLIQYLKSKGFSDQDLLQTSLSKKSQNTDSYAFFRKRITFPIYDTMGNIIAFGARSIDPNDQPKYLNSADHKAYEKSNILYGMNWAKQHVSTHQCLIIVEGYMDVIALHRLGFPIAVATCGTALTEAHIKLLKRHTENIYLLFDSDQAGQNATIRALGSAYQFDLFPKIIQLPAGSKDADDLANLPDGQEIWKKAFAEAKDGFITIFERLRASLDMTSPVDKQKLLYTLFGLIRKIKENNTSLQYHYLNELAKHLGFAYEILKPQYIQYTINEGKFLLRQQTSSTPKTSYQPERTDLFTALFYQDFYKQFQESETLWKPFFRLFELTREYLPEHSLSLALLDNDENLKQIQLRWDKELSDKEEDRRIILVKQTLLPVFQGLLKLLLKNTKLTPSQKQELAKINKDLLQ